MHFFISFKINIFFFFMLLILLILSNSQDLTVEIIGDSNNGKNNYYITLYTGENKKPQNFLLDTTGSLLALQCNLYSSNEKNINPNYLNDIIQEKDIINCKNNAKCINYPFSSCNNNQCQFEYNYKNSTIKGLYANQHLSFSEKGELHTFPLGCSLPGVNDFLAQETDGILGLNSQNNSFIDLLYKQKIISNKKFSICLNQKNGGYISFGQTNIINYNKDKDKDKKSEKILVSYIPYDSTNNGLYILDINALYVDKGNNLIKSGQNQKSIIDSISVKTYFTESIYNNLINDILSYCLNNKGNCKNIQKTEKFGYCSNFKSKQEIIKSIDKYWPIIIMEFNGYNHALYPQNYFIAYSSGGKIKACIGIEKSDNNNNILGATFLNGYNVIFDNENKNIGFYESNCDINKNIENEEYINRVFDDPINVIIVCVSIGGVILLIALLIILYRIIFKKTPKRKGYIRQVDINNSVNQYLANQK